MALAVGRMNLVNWEFLLCEWLSFGLSALFSAQLIETTRFMGKLLM